jgi:GNAT superfamily N-acetyltransferase
MSVDTQVCLRLALPEDEQFLEAVYASTRAEEMQLVPWTDEQKQAFVRMQYRAQRQSYQDQYPNSQVYVIEQLGQPVGRMIVDRSAASILLMDIALLPEYRNRGLGSALVRDLLDEADRLRKTVMLHVEDFNPAVNLYLRLGFVKTGTAGLYSEMSRQPGETRHD